MNNLFQYNPSLVECVVINELSAQSGLTPTKIASLLRLTKANVEQPAKDKFSELDPAYSHLLAGVLQHGLTAFDHHITAFTNWLQTPHLELACPLTGFFPTWPTNPPPPLEEMGAREPVDLMAYANQRDQQAAQHKSVDQLRPYPTPFSLLSSSSGIKLIDDIFVRIEAGVYY